MDKFVVGVVVLCGLGALASAGVMMAVFVYALVDSIIRAYG